MGTDVGHRHVHQAAVGFGRVAFRLMEILHKEDEAESLAHILDDFKVVSRWTVDTKSGPLTRVLLHQGKVEKLSDALVHRFGDAWQGRIILLPVEATLPHPPAPSGDGTGPRPSLRVAREQLYAQVNDALHLNPIFFAMAILSALVAGIGLLKDNVAIIIGGMVLAPLLSPTIAIGLATTLGDAKLSRRALGALAAGIAAALAASIALGALVEPNELDHPEILARTVVDNGDLLLALVAGIAGALAFTSAVSANLIGVMVAVAMMPPLVTGGMLIGAGRWTPGLTALLLVAINILGVNLAAVLTFLAQGVLPRQWWKMQRARRDAARAVLVLSALLIALAVAIHIARERGF